MAPLFTGSKFGFFQNVQNISSDDAYLSYVSLLLDMTGPNGSTSFNDKSTYQVPILVEGNYAAPPISSSQSVYGGSSANLNNGYLILPRNTTINDFSTGDLTIEMWFNPTSNNSSSYLWSQGNPNYTKLNLYLYDQGNGFARLGLFVGEYGNEITINGTIDISCGTNTWYHLAVTRQGNTYRTWVNGNLNGTGTNTASMPTQRTYIGKLSSDSQNINSAGYMSHLRVTKGFARYSAAFTIPTLPYTYPSITYTNPGVDSNFSNVCLLLHMNGQTDQSFASDYNVFRDNSKNGFVGTGYNGVHSYYNKKFGITSAYFSGSSSSIVFPNSSQFDLVGDFTIECWYYSISGSSESIVCRRSGGAQGWVLTTFGLRAVINGTWSDTQMSWTAAPQNTWNHIALVKTGTTLTAYVNGSLVATKTGVNSIQNPSTNLRIGIADGGSEGPFKGYMDEFRFTQASRYSGNFTLPTTPFPDFNDTSYSNSSLILMMDSSETNNISFADSSQNSESIVGYGGALITNALGKYGTYSARFSATGQYITVTPSNNHYYTGDFTIELWMYQTSYKDSVLVSSTHSSQSDVQIFRINSSGNGSIAIKMDNNEGTYGNIIGPVSSAFTTNTWNHLAFVRSGTTGTLYVNGVGIGTYLNWTTGFRADVIGALFNSGSRNSTYDYSGYIDALRFTKVAKYTSNFTASTTAFPNS